MREDRIDLWIDRIHLFQNRQVVVVDGLEEPPRDVYVYVRDQPEDAWFLEPRVPVCDRLALGGLVPPIASEIF